VFFKEGAYHVKCFLSEGLVNYIFLRARWLSCFMSRSEVFIMQCDVRVERGGFVFE
jgi:hypothetical protein